MCELKSAVERIRHYTIRAVERKFIACDKNTNLRLPLSANGAKRLTTTCTFVVYILYIRAIVRGRVTYLDFITVAPSCLLIVLR